jgi:hypothetical protein
MRVLVLAGVLLAAAGGFILARGLTYTSKRTVLEVGELKATVKEEHTIPTWVGGVALAGGIVLALAGLRARERS